MNATTVTFPVRLVSRTAWDRPEIFVELGANRAELDRSVANLARTSAQYATPWAILTLLGVNGWSVEMHSTVAYHATATLPTLEAAMDVATSWAARGITR